MSSKFSRRRAQAKRPPICISKPPPKPYEYPPYPYGEYLPDDPAWAWAERSRLPPVPPAPRQPITTWNLAFHLYPHPGSNVWLYNLEQLRNRWNIFNGRRVIAVATGPGLIPLDRVRLELPANAEILPIPNNPRLRETRSFLPLLQSLRSLATYEATFYAHSKGCSQHHHHQPGKAFAIEYWRNRMYHTLLDDLPRIQAALQNHATAGCFKIDYSKILDYQMRSPTGLEWGNWHFAGNFWWIRHDCIFRNPHWPEIADDPFAVEMWLGDLLPSHEAQSVYQPWNEHVHPPPNLYDPATHENRISAVHF